MADKWQMSLGAMVVKLLCRDCFQQPLCFMHIEQMIGAERGIGPDCGWGTAVGGEVFAWIAAIRIQNFLFHFAFLFDETCWQNSEPNVRNSFL